MDKIEQINNDSNAFARYIFRERSGYVLDARAGNALHTWLAVGHTAGIPPWTDPTLHQHQNSEEYYLLLQGELRFWVSGAGVTLQPNEILIVRPLVPHAITGGHGQIEHFGLRAPAMCDKQTMGEIPSPVPDESEPKRELHCDWGYRIPLVSPLNQNGWLLGNGSARFSSNHMSLAYLNFPTTEQANAGIGTRHRLHLHQASWEYYVVLRGTNRLQIEDELVEIEPGEMVEIPPGVRHTLHSRRAPFEGFTIRVPLLDWNDKIESGQ